MARKIQVYRMETHHAPGETSRSIVHIESQIEQEIIEVETQATGDTHEVPNSGNNKEVQTHLGNERLEEQRRNQGEINQVNEEDLISTTHEDHSNER